MMLVRHIGSILLFALLAVCAAAAQPSDSLKTDSEKSDSLRADSARAASAQHDAHRETFGRGDTSGPNQPTYVMTKSPTTAILLSLAVPGGGQIYNQQYWKAPLFFGGAAFFLGRALYLNSLYIDARNQAGQYPISSVEYQTLKQQRESYRDDRDLNYAYAGGVWILAMIDAYVGAHLFDFDVSTDHTSQIYLTPSSPGVGFAMRW